MKLIDIGDRMLIITDKKTLFKKRPIIYTYTYSKILSMKQLSVLSKEYVVNELFPMRKSKLIRNQFQRVKNITPYLKYII